MSSDHSFLRDDFLVAWSTLVPEAIIPDLKQALSQAEENIAALAAPCDSASLTYENTLIALENATRQLSYAWGLVNHLDAVRNSPAFREAYNAMLEEVTGFYSRIPLNPGLWARLKAYAGTDQAAALDPIKARFLKKTMEGFVSSGADLAPEPKARLEKLESELAQATQKFSENVLDSTNAWELILDGDARLAGLPETARGVLRAEATAKGLGTDEAPVYRITLKAPVYAPVLEYADDESLRREVWEGSITVGYGGEHDNTELLRDILRLRHEKATILGHAQFADHVLHDRMAQKGETALRFVDDLGRHSLPFFHRDLAELKAFRRESEPDWSGEFQPWDISYWSEKMRLARYDFDEEELRPYFSISEVIKGMFQLCEEVFGFTIVERETKYAPPGEIPSGAGVEVWHPEVRFYELRDSLSGEHLGSFYADWHPREEKRGGAWMNHLRTGLPATDDEPRRPHLGLICGNLTPSSANKPALLTHREVETVFHEFGHLIHHLLGEVGIESLNGIHVVWDFVELPSQILENFCWARVSLDRFARHYQTGEPIPEVLFNKLVAARNFQSGLTQVRQVSFGKMDLELHMHHHALAADTDLDALVRRIIGDYLIPLATTPPTMARRFTHLFANPTGYAAGYYSYKWAEVLDADAFTRFAADGVVSERVGREFREKILSRGDSREAGELFRDFMGRDPDPKALLERCGLVES